MNTTQRITIAFCCSLASLAGFAQAKDIVMEEAGTLSTLITADEKETIEELTISGPINGADIFFYPGNGRY